MRRTAALLAPLIGVAALAAGPRPAPVAAAAAAPAPASHYWVSVSDRAYLYYPRAHAKGGKAAADGTTVRYLGRQADGAWLVSEGEGEGRVLASCLAPCTQVRTRSTGFDSTHPFGGDSVTREALDDAIAGRLEVSSSPP
jgi:hypothetical protein